MATTLKPHSLVTGSLMNRITPAQRLEKWNALGPMARRHGQFPKGTVLPETIVPACPRVRVADLPENWLKENHIAALEQNQKISSCCRHPENHEVEAMKSHPEEQVPDIYIFHCTCGRKHRFFCVGATDPKRPMWDAS
jgi:hypothetical protein